MLTLLPMPGPREADKELNEKWPYWHKWERRWRCPSRGDIGEKIHIKGTLRYVTASKAGRMNYWWLVQTVEWQFTKAQKRRCALWLCDEKKKASAVQTTLDKILERNEVL